MALATKNFSIRPGATKALQFVWYNLDNVTKVRTPINLTSYTAKMQIRTREGDPTVLIECSTTNGKISLSSQGEVFVTIDATTTASYTAKRAVYDILLTNNGVVTEFISGIVSLDTGVTL
jgi:hypothetical protein